MKAIYLKGIVQLSLNRTVVPSFMSLTSIQLTLNFSLLNNVLMLKVCTTI